MLDIDVITGKNLYFSDILNIEYQSARIFTNALGLQAVVERTIADTTNSGETFPGANHFLIEPGDYDFIQEVVESSLETLRLAIRLADRGQLIYAPVRIFLRLTSASIHLLKGIGIGVGASKLRSSLQTLNTCIACLRASAPDDMHLGSSYATLLEMHVDQLQERFVSTDRPHNLTTRPPSLERTQVDASLQHEGAPGYQPELSSNADNGLSDADAGLLEEWLTLPFESSFLPLGPDSMDQGLPWVTDTSLDFIWNLQS